MFEHLIKPTEKDGQCMYCHGSLHGLAWTSSFFSAIHYKTVVCICGKLNCVRVRYIGTGHDSWSPLEQTIHKESGPKTSISIMESKIKLAARS